MHIDFDARKNDANILERKLSFERAADFDFSTAVVKQDTRKANLRETKDYDQTHPTH